MKVITPEMRATFVESAIRRMGQTYCPVDVFFLFQAVRDEFGLAEEDATLEIMAAVSLLIRGGVLACNDYDPETGTISYGQGTTVTLSRSFTSFIWDDDYIQSDAEEDAE